MEPQKCSTIKHTYLDTYDYILDLDVRHVMAEVFTMDYYFRYPEHLKSEHFKITPFPLVSDVTLLEEELRENQLSGDERGIFLQNFSTLCSFVNSCLADGRITMSKSGILEAREDISSHDIYNQPMFYDIDDPMTAGHTGLFVDVSLDLMSDDEMLSSFKVLLKKWRAQTGTPEPIDEDRRRFGASTIAKIYQYRVLPYLDIARWAQINDMAVSNEIYARLLFPHPLPNGEIKGGSHVRDSVKPFAESAGEQLNSISMKKYYANNPHIENMRFSDFLKLVDFQ